jgi:hypothetical protein
MDRTAAIAELPNAYATALRLRDEKLDDEAIAARLGIEVDAVAPLLRIAVAKLDGILRSQRPALSTSPHHHNRLGYGWHNARRSGLHRGQASALEHWKPSKEDMNLMDATVLQGLGQHTLVAGKTTVLRLYGAADILAAANRIDATVLRPDGSRVSTSWPSNGYVAIPQGSLGPSVVVRLPGSFLPWVGAYYITARILDAADAVLSDYGPGRVDLLPTKDLRVMVARIWSGTTTKAGEIAAAQAAMTRLSGLFPLRDGISTLDGDRSAGLRYSIDDNPIGPPNQDGNLGPLFDKWLDRPADVDSIDAAITYRFPNPGEGSGGNAGHRWKSLQFSVIVWGAPLANVFCQETSHIFGLEPPEDPRLDPNHGPHSKDVLIDAKDAELGFDPQYNEAWPDPTHDLMYFEGPDPGYTDNSITLNSWDWEYLRKRIAQLPSTGPTGPFIWWQSLEGHDLRPFPAVGKNADGRQEAFVLGGDQAIYHRWETSPGGDWSAWASLGGHDLRLPLRVASTADGRIQLHALGDDRRIYYRGQTAPNGDWIDWSLLGGTAVKDFAVNRNGDGRLEVVAVWDDGALHHAWQEAPNGGWSDWASLVGHDLHGEVALGQNADDRLEAFAIGGDGVVYHRWQLGPNARGGWSDWSGLGDPSLPPIADLAVANGADGRLFLFLMRSDGALSYWAQVAPNGGWAAPAHLGGHDLRWPCAIGRNPDGRLEVFVIGGDLQVYNRWQTEPAGPDAWSDWVGLGGRQIHAGIGLGTDPAGDLELFVIGGDGKLYRGPRPSAQVLFAHTSPVHAAGFAIDRQRELIDIHAHEPQLGAAAAIEAETAP